MIEERSFSTEYSILITKSLVGLHDVMQCQEDVIKISQIDAKMEKDFLNISRKKQICGRDLSYSSASYNEAGYPRSESPEQNVVDSNIVKEAKEDDVEYWKEKGMDEDGDNKKELDEKDIFKGPIFKLKRTTNETSGGGGGGGGTPQGDQPTNETSQVPASLSLKSMKNVGGDDDDDDGDDERKQVSSYSKKRLGCDQPSEKKPKKTVAGEEDESSQEDAGRGNHPSPSRGDGNEVEVAELAMKKLSFQGSSVEAGNLSNQVHKDPVPRIPKNQKAACQHLLDNGNCTGASVGPAGDNNGKGFSMASCPLIFNPHNKNNTDQYLGDDGHHTGATVSPQKPCRHDGRAARVPGAAEFRRQSPVRPEDPLDAAILQREVPTGPSEEPLEPTQETGREVKYGSARDIGPLVARIISHKDIGDKEQDGVLLTKELFIENGSYKDNLQYYKLSYFGHGSFGDVYLMQDKDTRKNFVGKRVELAKFSPNEALLWCDLEHPYIVRFLGLVMTEGMVFFFSEYCYGQTLQKKINDGILGQGRALGFLEQIFEALKYLHRNKIIHKDIKPDNILVGQDDRIQLIDFGSSRRAESQLMVPQDPEGTQCYMAPEIAKSEDYNEKVDIWSAFCTFICLICGCPPWHRRFQKFPIKFFIIATNPAPLQDVPPDTDPRIRQLIMWGLQKDIHLRPTAAQVLDFIRDQIPELQDELYDELAVMVQEPDLAPAGPFGMPKAVSNQPLTPCTPRGPQTEFFERPFATPTPKVEEETSLDISSMFLSPPTDKPAPNGNGIVLSVEGAISEVQPIVPQGEEEDIYGPSPDTDVDEFRFGLGDGVPKVNIMDQGQAGNVSSNGPPNSDIDSPDPLLGIRQPHSRVSPVYSQAAQSFIHDQSVDNGTDQAHHHTEDSFELPDLPQATDIGNSVGLGESWTSECGYTASDNVREAAALPSREGTLPIGAASGRGKETSGFLSNSPKETADFSSAENLEGCSSAGIVLVIHTTGCQDIRMKPPSDYDASDVAKGICSQVVHTPFYLQWTKNGLPIKAGMTFSGGEHHLNAVAATDDGDWMWCIDSGSHIHRR